jgi:hypothetical protein
MSSTRLIVSSDCEFLPSSAPTLFTRVAVSLASTEANASYTVTLSLPGTLSAFVGKTVRFELARKLEPLQLLTIRLDGAVAYGCFVYDAYTTPGNPDHVRAFTFHGAFGQHRENAVGDWVQFSILAPTTVLYTGAFANGNPVYNNTL